MSEEWSKAARVEIIYDALTYLPECWPFLRGRRRKAGNESRVETAMEIPLDT
jgi:hypothetical protein